MNSYKFLLVEDDEVDILTVKKAFDKAKISNPIHIANNGIEALEYLRGENGREKLDDPLSMYLCLHIQEA